MGARCLKRYSQELSHVRQDKNIEKATKAVIKEKIVRKRRAIMWGTVLLNFLMLAYFKYVGVIMENVADIFRISLQGNAVYHHALGLVLPLGISFYIFQSLGYLLDVYNDKYEPEKNFAKYMLFVSYFPQIIQGPINRYDTIREEFRVQHLWNGEQAVKALYRVFYGMLKKYAIANIFAGIIANIFDNPVRDYSGAMVLVGILLYSAQQYADFSGGIDMVLGVSELFGIHMAENFRQPYFATSLADFWRRWHISLGKWMRDYVFYPFALTRPMKKFGKWANKKLNKHLGRVLPAALGNILVFFVVGLWHGAEWHYIIWGIYNGVVIAFSDILSPVFARAIEMFHINTKAVWYYVFQVVRTFAVVNIGWYFDRIVDVKVALYSLKKSIFDFNIEMFAMEYGIVFDGYPNYILVIAVFSCFVVFLISILSERKNDVRSMLYGAPLGIRWIVYLLVIGLILFANTCAKGAGGFMYANF